MGVVVKKVELSWLDRTYVWPVMKGMSITFGHFLRNIFTPTAKRYTVQYPDMKRELPEGYRGLHELKRFEDGAIKCVACFVLKLVFFAWVFVWIRWTVPRFRYDQLMHMGWKVMLPMSMANLIFHAWRMSQGH